MNMLTSREKEILKMVSEGKMNNEIAAELFISPATVKTHVKNIYQKLRVRNRIEAIVYYNRERNKVV